MLAVVACGPLILWFCTGWCQLLLQLWNCRIPPNVSVSTSHLHSGQSLHLTSWLNVDGSPLSILPIIQFSSLGKRLGVQLYEFSCAATVNSHTPGVAAVEYVSTRHQYPWLIPLQNSEFKLSQWNCLLGMWLASGHVVKMFSYFSHTLLTLHAMFGMWNQIFKYTKRDIILRLLKLFIHLQTGVCICTVLTAEVVATGEVNCLFNSATFHTVHGGSARVSFAWQTPQVCEGGKNSLLGIVFVGWQCICGVVVETLWRQWSN